MKARYFIILFILFPALLVISCKTGEKVSKAEVIKEIEDKVLNGDFTFEAQQAHPMSGRVVHLTSSYNLRVKPDSVIAYLPYFGRAYTAPSPLEEGGIKFTSTDFKYSVSGKNKGVYRVSIDINDNSNDYRLSLMVGETGYTTLYVGQKNKQSITFYGRVE